MMSRQPETTPDWLCYSPNPTRPQFLPPAGAVDAHCHVFGPSKQFPFAPERKYTPCDAGKDDLFRLRDFLGFSRNVVVQATCHGSDNSALIDALAHGAAAARGVVTVKAGISHEELAVLHAAGVRGVRFDYVRRLVDPKPDAYYFSLVDKITAFGWHVVMYFEATDLVDRWDFFTSLQTTLVVDHMGRPDVTKDPNGPEFGRFLSFMDRGNVVCKVTCPERLSQRGPPGYEGFIPFARCVVERFPERVIWGTDWPHPNMTSHMPDDGHLVDMIPRIAPTTMLQNKLLVENPIRLYWPEEV